ncbi:hypothetical protein DJ031_18590 [bacterium endosymbiont of Escarpia laminata]|nr:MAG: hypothetical protein DJ031_18590 [bacterium endosymbiont of Escarpia laminata]
MRPVMVTSTSSTNRRRPSGRHWVHLTGLPTSRRHLFHPGSVDPYGKQMRGDMGWVKEGSGHPDSEKAVSGLEDNQLSEIVQTPAGFHLVMIIERRPSLKRSFVSMPDKVAQSLITEKSAEYISELSERYKVVWNLIGERQAQIEKQ